MSAKVVAVNAELNQLGLVLQMYTDDNHDRHPPTRKDCSLGWQDHQLPPELVEGGYLPPPKPGNNMSAGIEDRFNKDNTYKYACVGELYQNNQFMGRKEASLFVPSGYPSQAGLEGKWVNDPDRSPVRWVLYSYGPKFDTKELNLNYPLVSNYWYDPAKGKGILTRICLKNGTFTGSF